MLELDTEQKNCTCTYTLDLYGWYSTFEQIDTYVWSDTQSAKLADAYAPAFFIAYIQIKISDVQEQLLYSIVIYFLGQV